MKQENGPKRIQVSLIESFSNFIADQGLPLTYGPPAAMTILSSMIGRRLFIRTNRGRMFLNAFRFLIGAPGIGKSLTTDLVDQCLKESKLGVMTAAKSVTKASFVDEIAAESSRRPWGVDASEIVSALLVNSSEYGVFLGDKTDESLLRTLCDMFDGRTYIETRRSIKTGPITVEIPYLNILTATQPEHFAVQFPRQAWASGMANRCDFYVSETMAESPDYYLDYSEESNSRNNLVNSFCRDVAHDLQCIAADISANVGKQIVLTEEARDRFIDWYEHDRVKTQLTHPWLLDYNTRRAFRLRRDAALVAIARADTDYTITLPDLNYTIDLHLDQEFGLINLLHKAVASDSADIINLIYAWAMREFLETKKPIQHSRLTEQILTKVEVSKVNYIISHLISTEALFAIKQRERSPGVYDNLSVPEYKPNLKYRVQKA